MKRFFITLSSLVFIGSVGAQTYMEFGYTSTNVTQSVTYSGNTYRLTASPTALRAVLGYEVNSNLSIEGMLAQGLDDSNVSVSGIPIAVKYQIDNIHGIYIKPKISLAPGIEAFARVGYAHGSATATYQNISSSGNGNSFSYGLGLSYAINDKLSINVDAMSYYDKDSMKATGTTVGVGYKF